MEIRQSWRYCKLVVGNNNKIKTALGSRELTRRTASGRELLGLGRWQNGSKPDRSQPTL
jgi:hypothetical protein